MGKLNFRVFPQRTDHARVIDFWFQPLRDELNLDLLVIQMDKEPDDRTEWLSIGHTRYKTKTCIMSYAVSIKNPEEWPDKPNPVWEVHVPFQRGTGLEKFVRIGDRLYWGHGKPTHGRYKRR